MFMLDEILDQPDGIAKTIEGNRESVRAIASAIKARTGVDFALLIGRGTSDNAATYAKYLLALINGMPAGLAAPSLSNLYEADLRLDRVLAIAVSQSGETDEVVQALEHAASHGAFTLAVTNEENSTLARTADAALVCLSGRERSIPATKTYTAELAALALFSLTLAERSDLLAGLGRLPDAIETVLDTLGPRVEEVAARYRFMSRCIVLGRGLNYATALEAALKLKETCGVGAEALSAADFLHGPIAALPGEQPVFIFAPDDPTIASTLSITERLTGMGAEVAAVTDSPEMGKKADITFHIPTPDDRIFWPFFGILPLQLLSCRLAVEKGLDPDHPRGLSKITHSGRLQSN